MAGKYLSKKEIDEIIGEIVFDKEFCVMSVDSYNEEKIAKKIASLAPKELCYCAVNMAVVGFGNTKMGQYRIGETIYNIAQILGKHNVKFNNQKGAVLKDDDLTANRLCRFFRETTQKYLAENNANSYMWRKYSTKDLRFTTTTFRGAEYLDLNKDEADYLLSTVIEMDKRLGINVADRVYRVFDAKKKTQYYDTHMQR